MGADVKVGDTVTVVVDGQTVGTTKVVEQDGKLTWTAEVDGSVLDGATADSVTATVTTTDDAGNSATATDDHPYNIDTDIAAAITITSIATDGVINADEAHSKVPVTGTVGADVKVGDTVTVVVDGQTVGTTKVVEQDGKLTWTAEVDGSVLDGATADSVTATVTTTDEAGNSATATDDHPYNIDTDIAATITITSIATDGVINADEAHSKVPVTGTVGADVKVGDTVTVVVDGQTVGTTKVVEQDGKLTWTAEVDGSVLDGATADSVTATVTTTDEAGNSATATDDHPYNIDTDIAAAITITSIATDGVINADEAHSKVPVTGTVGADVKVGDTVTVVVDGQTVGTTKVVEQDGKLTWTAEVDGSVLDGATADSVTATVTTTDEAGNSATATDDHIYTVDTDIAAAITITSIATDGVINAEEAHSKVPVTGTVGADVKVGDTVTVVVDGQTVGTTKVVEQDGKLTWTAEVDGSVLDGATADSVTATVTTTDEAGNSATATDDHIYTVDTDIAAAITITSIATDGVINADEAHSKVPVTGTVGADVKVGDTVTVVVDGQTVGTTKVVEQDGKLTWTAEVDGSVLDGATADSVTATVTTTDEAGNSATATDDHPYNIDTDIAAAITITSIATDDNVTGPDSEQSQAIIGTVGGDVKAGDWVTVTLDGKTLGTAEVQADKSWRLSVDGKVLLDAKTDHVGATVTTTDTAGNSKTATAEHNYTVDVNATIDIDKITGDNIITQQEGHEKTINVTGKVGGQAREGDEVTVTINGNKYVTHVQTDLTWIVAIAGIDILHAHKAIASVTTSYSSHNVTTEADEPYTVDIGALVTIDSIADDNIVTQAEGKSTVTIKGSVGEDVKDGDTVTLTIDGQQFTGEAKDGHYQINVDGEALLNDSDRIVDASVTTSDGANHTASDTAEKAYQIDGAVIQGNNGDNTITGTAGTDLLIGDLDPAKVVETSTNVNFVIDTSGSMFFGRLLTLDAVEGHKADYYRIYVAGNSELTAADGTRISNSQGWVTVTYDQLKDGLQYDAGGYSDIYIKSSDGVDFSHTFKSLPSIFDMTKQAYDTLTTSILDSTNDKSLLKFNIVTFNGSVQGNESFHYDEKTHQFVNSHNVLINNYINNLTAGGGTQFEGALKAASANIVDSNERNIVYFLSDGKDEDSFHPNGIHFLPNTEIVSIAVGPSGDGTQVNEIAKLGVGYDDNNSTAPSYSQVITNANELNNAFHDIGQHFIPGSDTIIGSDDNDVLAGDALNIKWMYDDGLLSGTYQEPKSDDESTKPANLLKQYLADKDYDGNVDKVLTSDLNHFIANHLDKFGNNAYGGNDHLTGGKGNDILIGDGGNDSLNGGLGNDFLNGGFGNDNLIGGEGKDTFLWSENNFGTDAIPAIDTIMDFEKGIDTIELGDSLHVKNIQSLDDLNNRLNIIEQQGNTEIQIFDDQHQVVQNIILNGISHNDLFGNNATSMSNEDKLDALLNSGNLELSDNFGNQQANTLTADNQGESLFGFDGNDILVAGQGNDILTGGHGDDVFTWHETSLSTVANTDTIADFELDKDQINIHDLLTDDENASLKMDDLLSHVSADVDNKGNVNLEVSSLDGKSQHIVLENINPQNDLGLADGASSADIVSSLFNHNAFHVDNNN
ncbi:Poly(beta-D-mannuronate) C5 epimerase 5 [Photobacterium piscicola]|uniref:Poly(Beta-D-mannuronate) C5 epimerase 5 n=1 Tax=Photobacterium piscicola TaxID=1378299 RepID=A0A1T5I5D2_9GAMM|nr:Poly(beta-D-mannuronate) C5 epimerase 5 [Photobacterium piscicola]